MCENFSKTRTCPSQAKNNPWGSSSFNNQFCTYIHIYTHICSRKRMHAPKVIQFSGVHNIMFCAIHGFPYQISEENIEYFAQRPLLVHATYSTLVGEIFLESPSLHTKNNGLYKTHFC